MNLRHQTIQRFRFMTVGVAFTLLLTGCGSGGDSSGEFYTNWDLAGGCRSDEGGAGRYNAQGDLVDVCAAVDPSRWVWVTYAAGWCTTSRTQAPQIRQFTGSANQAVTVFTVLTGGDEVFTDPGLAGARAWSRSYGLPPERVLIEESSRVIPQHLILGPNGRTWYRYIGFLTTAEMVEILDEFANGARHPNVREIRRR